MIRHFFPVGHGAFYAEEFETFYIVYDCGTLASVKEARKIIEPIIKHGMDVTKPILALFISHFDADHINGIVFLKENNFNIQNIFFPYVTDKEITTLEYFDTLSSSEDISDYLGNTNNIISRIINLLPIEGTNLYAVRAVSSNQDDRYNDSQDDESNEPISLNVDEDSALSKSKFRGNIKTISSGVEVTIDFIDWIYIPYNFDFSQGRQDFIGKVKIQFSDTFSNTNFKNDDEIFEFLKQELIKNFYETKNKLKNCFGKTGPEIKETNQEIINKKSLVVYSGPIKSPNNFYRMFFYDCHNENILNNLKVQFEIVRNKIISYIRCYDYNNELCDYKSGCLYLGDCNAKKDGIFNQLIEKYKDYIYHIGIIQIPHHGSEENSDEHLFNFPNKNVLYIISASESDKKHPAISIIESLLINCCQFRVVTKENDTLVLACIRDNFKSLC